MTKWERQTMLQGAALFFKQRKIFYLFLKGSPIYLIGDDGTESSGEFTYLSVETYVTYLHMLLSVANTPQRITSSSLLL